ncbi:uncharacterized protein LOC132038535 [Lycium ferocissimum]|uniref:uncharacterized protein LOC132038535 n=1 Tax=Lycium ferocissimum TaxID=112874 RepID=UPI0028164617|nr:uncharacterized protein LOC132038535 [Lycium ferocissimum]
MVDVTHRCSSIVSKASVQKKEDPGAFTIPCTIVVYKLAKALCDLCASINLMPLAIFKKSGLGTPRTTTMSLLMADQIVKRPVEILNDVLVKQPADISVVSVIDTIDEALETTVEQDYVGKRGKRKMKRGGGGMTKKKDSRGGGGVRVEEMKKKKKGVFDMALTWR